MKKSHRDIVYSICLLIFLISFMLMIYYGKVTFYVDKEVSDTTDYDYHFVLITEEVGNDYWNLIETGAKQEAEKYNIYLDFIGPSKSDNEEQLQMIDRMISSNVDGIITQGIPGERFGYLVDKASDNQIPVATIDTDAPTTEREFYVGTDNYKAGYLAGKTLIADTQGNQFVGVVIGMFEALNQQERLDGFRDAVEEVERIHIIDILESNITEIGAAQASYSLLKQYPQLNVLFGTSALDGIGIVQGIEEINPRMDHYILAFDTLPETLQLIEKGKIDATIVQYPSEMGRLAVELMMKVQQSRSVNGLNYTDSGVIRKENLRNGEIVSLGEEQ